MGPLRRMDANRRHPQEGRRMGRNGPRPSCCVRPHMYNLMRLGPAGKISRWPSVSCWLQFNRIKRFSLSNWAIGSLKKPWQTGPYSTLSCYGSYYKFGLICLCKKAESARRAAKCWIYFHMHPKDSIGLFLFEKNIGAVMMGAWYICCCCCIFSRKERHGGDAHIKSRAPPFSAPAFHRRSLLLAAWTVR